MSLFHSPNLYSFISGSASFEKELKKILQYATIWQAVVLLDEADVFLEARKDVGSTERNSLVAGEFYAS